jgi:hypothetical protein
MAYQPMDIAREHRKQTVKSLRLRYRGDKNKRVSTIQPKKYKLIPISEGIVKRVKV